MAPGKPQPPRPVSGQSFASVKLETRNEPAQGEPASYRERVDTLKESPAPPSASIVTDADLARLLRENERLRDERDAARAQRPAPPPLPQRSPSHYPVSTPSPGTAAPSIPPKVDEAIGRAVRQGGLKLWHVLAMVGIVGGGGAAAKVADDAHSSSAQSAQFSALESTQKAQNELLSKLLQREAVRDAYIQCLVEQNSEAFESLLPAPDRMGSARLPRPWVERCSRLKP